jgi:hypothetical protein
VNASNDVARTIVYFGFFCLLLSSAVRYYAAAIAQKSGQVRHSKTARAVSIELLMIAVDAILFVAIVSIILSLSGLLGISTFPLASIITLFVFLGMAYVEAKVLNFYASLFLILKRDARVPLVSNLFAWLSLSLYSGFVVTLTVFSIIKLSAFLLAVIFVGSWIGTYIALQTLYLQLTKAS